MKNEILLIVSGALGSSVLTAWATGYFTKPKTQAEAMMIETDRKIKENNAWKEDFFDIKKEVRELRAEFRELQDKYNTLEEKHNVLQDQYDSLSEAYEHTKRELEAYQNKPKETTTTISQVTT